MYVCVGGELLLETNPSIKELLLNPKDNEEYTKLGVCWRRLRNGEESLLLNINEWFVNVNC